MKAWAAALLALPLLGPATALAGPELRLELLGDASPPVLIDALPLARARPGTTALALLAQLEPTLRPPAAAWTLSAAWAGQSVQWEPLLPALSNEGRALHAVVGVHARGLLPVGVHAGALYRQGGWTTGLCLRRTSAAAWADLEWQAWRWTPGLSVGWSPKASRPRPPTAAAEPKR